MLPVREDLLREERSNSPLPFARKLVGLFVVQPLRELRRPPKGQVASLDFLRTCAILLVVAFHFSTDAYPKHGGHENAVSRIPLVLYGWIGVDLFFVLSGYFIGKQLWRELSQRGTIDLKRFLLRRGLRIWPLYYAVLLFVLVLGAGTSSPLGLCSNLLFVNNYLPHYDLVQGSWSLCVEEQFYLIAPSVLLVGAAFAVTPRRYRVGLIALFSILPLVRAVVHLRLTGDLATHVEGALRLDHIFKPIHTHADGLVMGLLLAHLDVFGGDRLKRGLLASGWPVLFSALVFVPLFRSDLLNLTACALFFGSCTWYLVAQRRRWLSVLEWRGFYLLSRLSYGMYLNHFFLNHPMADFSMRCLPWASAAPALHQVLGTILFAASSAGVAVVTFCLIEWPFLQLREWLYANRVRKALPTPNSSGRVISLGAAPADKGRSDVVRPVCTG
jgi:peptidoglycan/LPS O-acetylase OafA/YrhL